MFWLLACACPTFEETEIVDLSTDGEPDGVATEARKAIDLFAAWTAREGVCVGEVRVQDAVISQGDPMAGRYLAGPRQIEVDRHFFPVREVVVHELCHALDREADISAPAAELYPYLYTERSKHYPDEVNRRRETFARTCENGPDAWTVALAIDAICDEGLVDEVSRHLAEVVYPGARSAALGDGSVAVRLVDRTISTPDDAWVDVHTAIGTDDGLVLVVEVPARKSGWGYRTELWLVDPDTGTIRERVSPELQLANWQFLAFPSDERPYLLARPNGWAWRGYWLDGTSLVEAPAPEFTYATGYGLVADGVLHYGTVRIDETLGGETLTVGELRAMRLSDGVELALDFPVEAWDRSVWPTGMALGPDGPEMLSVEGWSRFDGEGWSRDAEALEELEGLVFLDGRRVSVAALPDGTRLPLVEEDGVWLLPDDPCVEARGGRADRLVEVGDRVFLVADWAQDQALALYEVVLE